MPVDVENMLKLVASGSYGRVEETWMEAVEDAETDPESLLPVLEALIQAGQAESAELLGWSTVSEARKRLDPQACLDFIKRMFLAVPESDDLRAELVNQYKIVHAGSPRVDELTRASGLADGSKKPRLALRTLDLCLAVEPGSYLYNRQDDTVAEVIEVSRDCRSYTVRFNRRTREYDAHELTAEFGHADPDDFRVLAQCRPDRLAELLDKSPAALIVSILKAQAGRLTADDLRYTLCPRFLPQDKWSKWWTRARAELKKHHTVRLEGRSPVVLVYDPTGWTIEDVCWENFPKSEAAADYYDAVEAYFREAKSRKLPVKPDHLSRMARAMGKRIESVARHLPDKGLGLALVVGKLLERGAVLDSAATVSAAHILRDASNPAQVLGELSDARLWAGALEATKEARPDAWQEVFAELLPGAPMQACELIAEQLRAARRTDLLNRSIAAVMEDPQERLEAVAWLWKRNDTLDGTALPTRVEVLTKMLAALGALQRSGTVGRDRLGSVKAAVKNALSASQCRAFKECLDGMEEGMAAAIRNQVSRLDGIGPSLRDELIEEIRKRFPALWTRKQIEPWKDDSAIYCTPAGMDKLEKAVDHLVNVEMPANAKAIGEAAAHGDLSENAEYKFALEARDMLRARLAKLQQQLSRARIIDPDDVPTDYVGVGSRTVLRRTSDSTCRTLTFLGPWEAAVDQGIYNYQAPLSQQLMGRAPGDAVRVDLGDGESEWTVEQIARGV